MGQGSVDGIERQGPSVEIPFALTCICELVAHQSPRGSPEQHLSRSHLCTSSIPSNFIPFIMAARLRMPTLAFTALSICLSIAIIGCTGRTINVFQGKHKSNPWLLPIWPNHFDTRELHALAGTSAAIVVLNGLLALALFVPKVCWLSCYGMPRSLTTDEGASATGEHHRPALFAAQHHLRSDCDHLPNHPEPACSHQRHAANLDLPLEQRLD